MTTPGENLRQAYALRVAGEEIDELESTATLREYPHIARFVVHPRGAFLLRHVQNLCWTLERWARKLRTGASSARGVAESKPPALTSVFGSTLPNLWIDVTDTYRFGFNGGISRVVLKLAEAAIETRSALPVLIEGGAVYEYVGPARKGRRLTFHADVTYVIADSFWSHFDETREACLAAQRAGAEVIVCVHDVIPFYYPSFNRATFGKAFIAAMEEILVRVDGCIAVSRYSADQVRDLVERRNLRPGRPLPVAHFHLGADGVPQTAVGRASDQVRAIFARQDVFLSVGTLEPRKGYAVTLDAFDAVWSRGHEATFVMIGRVGWISNALVKRIREHPRYGTSLFWLEKASDADVAFAYRSAYCVVQASITEGFGLPIVEASAAGTPIIATDNAIFRELAGDAITYFRSCDAADLAARIEMALARRPDLGVVPMQSWAESLAQMKERIATMPEAQPLPKQAALWAAERPARRRTRRLDSRLRMG